MEDFMQRSVERAHPLAAPEQWDCILLSKSIPFLLVHLTVLGAFLVPFETRYLRLAIGLYFLRMFGVTAGYHRYFSHRAYKTSRIFQFLLALLAVSSAQKGVLWWAAHHRRHHRDSDRPEDVHSPVQRGLWWAHIGWIFSRRGDDISSASVADFARYAELRWLEKWHLVPPGVLATGLYLWGGLPAVIWGFCVSTTLLWHGTFTINSLAHAFGSRRYPTNDNSRNNVFLSLLTLGEGWHNNHHFYKSAANQGFFWWEFDPTFYALRVLSWLGIIWDVRTPPHYIIMEVHRKTAPFG
jgi:stearoyl-CoA desaturase (delta-9 desaturase)